MSDYLTYPKRRPGLDHGRYAHRYLKDAAPIAWPNKARIALWITMHVEFFPMDMPRKPFIPPGGMDRPGVSFWDYTLRDYGNRVGVYRIIKAMEAAGARGSAAMNSEIAERHPFLVERLLERDWEIVASGVDMGLLHHSGVPKDEERARIGRAVSTLSQKTKRDIAGWHSPACSESHNTPDLVAQAGLRYIADWCNDDAPYWMNTAHGRIVSMPFTYELSDTRILFQQNQSLAEWETQMIDAFQVLHAEAGEHGGRVLSLSLSPWIIGQPYRIAALERVLGRIMAHEGVWSATAGEIAACWSAQNAQT